MVTALFPHQPFCPVVTCDFPNPCPHTFVHMPLLNDMCHLFPARTLTVDTVSDILKQYIKCWVRPNDTERQFQHSAFEDSYHVLSHAASVSLSETLPGLPSRTHLSLYLHLSHSPPSQTEDSGQCQAPPTPSSFSVCAQLPGFTCRSFHPPAYIMTHQVVRNPSQAQGPRFLGSQHSAWPVADPQ